MPAAPSRKATGTGVGWLVVVVGPRLVPQRGLKRDSGGPTRGPRWLALPGPRRGSLSGPPDSASHAGYQP